MYEYRAHVVKVYDGDTVTVDIDLGFGIFLHKQKIRLEGLNTPEVRGESKLEGIISRDALRERIFDKDIIIKTKKDKKGKYGRWIATIFFGGEDINQWLINEGYAEFKKY